MYGGMVVGALIYAVEENKRFNEYCSTLSPEAAKAARKARSERFELEAQRRHEIEVAKAGKDDSSGGLLFGLGLLLGLNS